MDGKKRKRHVLEIDKVIPPDDKREPVPEYMKSKLFPGFPTTTLVIGQPGSGKTNLIIHMLKSPHFWKGFFDKIYMFGPTCKSDQLYKSVKIDPDQMITEVNEFLPRLKEILAEQQAACESNWNTADKLLFIFEDLTSLFHKVQGSPEFIRCYSQIRHLKASSVSMVHKYKAFNRTARMCSNHIIFFKGNNTEFEQLYTDFGSSYFTKPEFIAFAKSIVKKTPDCPHPFFYINLEVDENIRYRRTFVDIFERTEDGGFQEELYPQIK